MLLPSVHDPAGIFAYAMSFNAYTVFGSFEAAADIARRAPRSTLEEVRAELFFKARAARHSGTDLHVQIYSDLLPLLERFSASTGGHGGAA
jgi:hypothetical protein